MKEIRQFWVLFFQRKRTKKITVLKKVFSLHLTGHHNPQEIACKLSSGVTVTQDLTKSGNPLPGVALSFWRRGGYQRGSETSCRYSHREEENRIPSLIFVIIIN